MKQAKPAILFVMAVIAFLTGILPSLGERVPARAKLENVPYVQQLKNYCGPASLASVLNYWGLKIDQKAIGADCYDPAIEATNGADMMFFARNKGYSAYSWNSGLLDIKNKLAQGVPVIVIQDTSLTDKSGHYRVAVGYDDDERVIYVIDPYEPETRRLSYDLFESLWERHGYWALLICPAKRDTFRTELDEKNPVVHLDLAYVYYKNGQMKESERESRLALALEPGNYTAKDILAKSMLAAAGSRAKQRLD